MKNVGILAAMTLAEVGPVSDVKGFFNLIVSLLESDIRGSKYPWVTEKLYRRSLAYDDLYKVKAELDSVKNELSCILTNSVEWLSFGIDEHNSRLTLRGMIYPLFLNVFLKPLMKH